MQDVCQTLVKRFSLCLMTLSFLVLAVMPTGTVSAQNSALPTIPDPLQAMVDNGAQIRYLGKMHGLDSWITIFKGQEQYYYVLPGGEAFLLGVMFDNKGNEITTNQVRQLQKQGDSVLDALASAEFQNEIPDMPMDMERPKPFTFQTKAERMFTEIKTANWVPIGRKGTPVIYAFIDPQCPHCHDLLSELRKDYIEAGKLQVRILPVGFRTETLAQAAFLLAAPDAETRLFQHLDGDESAIPADTDINTQGVQRNMAVMQGWNFDVTPLTIYENRNGEIKMIRGKVKDIPAMVNDLR